MYILYSYIKYAGRSLINHEYTSNPSSMKPLCLQWVCLLVVLCSMFDGPISGFAEKPDAGVILRDINDKFPLFPDKNKTSPFVLSEKDSSSVATARTDIRIPVRKIVINGSTVFSKAALESFVARYVGREMTFEELNQVAKSITEKYVKAGYLAQTVLPPQEIRNGVVVIQVLEATLGDVEVTMGDHVRFSRNRAAGYVISAQPKGSIVRIKDLERGILLLKERDGIISKVVIRPGTGAGAIDAVVNLEKTPLFTENLLFDNFGAPSTGEHRGMATLNIHSPLKIGDSISLRALYSEGIRYGRMLYSLPVATQGAVAGFSLGHLDYKLRGEFTSLRATGSSLTAGTYLNVPLVVRRRSNLYSSINYDYRHFMDELAGVLTADRKFQVGSVTLNGGWLDEWLSGGFTTAGITYTFGSLDLSRLPSVLSQDMAGAHTAGAYQRLNISASRMQHLFDNRTSMSLSAAGQMASGNLDNFEKMTLGGPYAIRAYPTGEGSGDEGLLVVTELHRTLMPSLQLFGFYDYGIIRQFVNPWPGCFATAAPNIYSLDGAGLGMVFTPNKSFRLKSTVAYRLRHNPAANAQGKDHDGTFRDPRLWLEVGYDF